MFSYSNINKTAIIYKDEFVSYEMLAAKIIFLTKLINIKEQRIIIIMENRPEFVMALYAIWQNNSIAVPVDFMSTPDEIEHIIQDVTPALVIHSNKVLKNLEKTESFQNLKSINIDEITIEAKKTTEKVQISKNEEDTAVIIYTSGTTGKAKGVMLSFRNIRTGLDAVSKHVPIFVHDDRVLAVLPAHHVLPLMGTLVMPLSIGATVVFSSSLAGVDILNAMKRHKTTIMVGVPRLYFTLVKSIKDKIKKSFLAYSLYNFAKLIPFIRIRRLLFAPIHNKMGGSFRFFVCGGAKLEAQIFKDLTLFGFNVLEGFGMTEASPMITFPRPNEIKIGSVGRAVPNTEVKLDNGEIVARGPHIMKGYYNNPEETNKTLRDGWLYTGDLGVFDSKNRLYITGRKKELIILPNGKNINPVEIEHKLMEQLSEKIKEVAVFLENDYLYAIVVPLANSFSEDDLRKEIGIFNETVSPSKKIKRFSLVLQDLPRTRIGKIKRFLLPELVITNNFRAKSFDEPDFTEYILLKKYLKEMTGTDIAPTSHLELDLGMDSLDKVSLIVYIQSTFGLRIEEEKMDSLMIVLDLAEYVRTNKTDTREEISNINWNKILNDNYDLDINLPKSWFTQRMIKFFSKILLKIYFKIKVTGINNITTSPFIIASNHQSFIDGLFVAAFLNNIILKKTYFYAKAKHVKNPFLKFLANTNNVVVINKKKNVQTSLQSLSKVLKEGKNLIIFPEGTRTKDGNVGNFKKTFAILSKELNVPIIPVAIHGAYDALPKGKVIPRFRKKIEIDFLEPLYPKDQSYDDITKSIKNRIVSSLESKGE